jgi:tRNA threonylcarbamoyladenosine modification (KEOPS) complex  Pcc1 subunit
MATGANAKIRLKFNSQKQLSTLIDSLAPETNAIVTRRANIKLERDGLFLLLIVEAQDTVALRATLNAYMRWINSTINVIDVVKKT